MAAVTLNPNVALQVLGGGQPVAGNGNLVVSKDVAGTRLTVSTPLVSGQPINAVSQRANVEEAFVQTDYLNVNLAAGGELVVDLGVVHHFFDFSSTIIGAGTVKFIDPNGTPHDLFVWTKLKTTTIAMPGLPPGRYTFINISGSAISSKALYVVHTGPRNLA